MSTVKIMLFSTIAPAVELDTDELELYLKVMYGEWTRNAFLDRAADNPKHLPAFEITPKGRNGDPTKDEGQGAQ